MPHTEGVGGRNPHGVLGEAQSDQPGECDSFLVCVSLGARDDKDIVGRSDPGIRFVESARIGGQRGSDAVDPVGAAMMFDDGEPFGLGDGEHGLGAIEDSVKVREGQAVQIGTESEQHNGYVRSNSIDSIECPKVLMTGDDHDVGTKSGENVRGGAPTIEQIPVEQASVFGQEPPGGAPAGIRNGFDEEFSTYGGRR